MRSSVLSRVARLPERPARGLARPILGAFALVLVVVSGHVRPAAASAPASSTTPRDGARHAEQVLTRVQRPRAPRDRPRDRAARLPADPRRGVPGAVPRGARRDPGPDRRARGARPRARRSTARAASSRQRSSPTCAPTPRRCAPTASSMTRADVLDATAVGKAKVDAIRGPLRRLQPPPRSGLAVARRSAPRRAPGATGATGSPAPASRSPRCCCRRSRPTCAAACCARCTGVALAAGELADGRLDARVPAGGSGEIAQLGGAFNAHGRRAEPSASASCASPTIVCRASSTTRRRASASATPRAATCWSTAAGRRSRASREADALGRTDAELFGAAIAVPRRALSDLEVLRARRRHRVRARGRAPRASAAATGSSSSR